VRTRKALAAIEGEPVYRDRYASFVQSMVYGEKAKISIRRFSPSGSWPLCSAAVRIHHET